MHLGLTPGDWPMQIALLVHRTKPLGFFFLFFFFFFSFFFWGGGCYTIWISCSCIAMYMYFHTIIWWYIKRFATGKPWEDLGHQYFPHVGPERTCCSMHKNFDPWNSRQNKLKSQVYKLKTFGALIQYKDIVLPLSKGNPIVEIRRSYDRLISTMGFPILVRWHLYIESFPGLSLGFHMLWY